MSKRTERRAAERLARKAARTQITNITAAAPVNSPLLDTDLDLDDNTYQPVTPST